MLKKLASQAFSTFIWVSRKRKALYCAWCCNFFIYV